MPKLFGFSPQRLPGPRPLPLVGVPWRLYQFLDDPVGVVMGLRQHGDVVGVMADNPALVAVFGPTCLQEVLGNPGLFRNDEEVFTGPEGSRLDQLRHAIIAVNGDVHRRHRSVMMPAFRQSALDGYAREVAEVCEAMLDRWPLHEEVDIDVLSRELALSVAVRCFYGMDVLSGATELGHLAAELVATLTDPLTILTPINLPGTPYRRAVRLADKLLGELSELVDEKRARGPGGSDALSLLLHTEAEGGVALSDDELPYARGARDIGQVRGDIHELVDLSGPRLSR